jgi:hypothetical protein
MAKADHSSIETTSAQDARLSMSRLQANDADQANGETRTLLGAGPTRHMMVHIAGGLRLEFIAAGARAAGDE